MTNLSIIVTLWVHSLTNPVPAGQTTNGQNFFAITRQSTINQYLPDGSYLNCSTMTHVGYVTNPPSVARVDPPIPERRPGRPTGRSTTTLFQFSPQVANGGSDNVDNLCPMFKTWFTTNTNWIYGLESSSNMVHWALCPPEIDGTGSPEYFFDALFNNEARSYRIASRVGVLPE